MSLIKKLKILPTEIYEFKVPYELNRKALALVKEQDWNKMYKE